MGLLCVYCKELLEIVKETEVCEECQKEVDADQAAMEDSLEYGEFEEEDCPDCVRLNHECLPCKIAREAWLVSIGVDPQSLDEPVQYVDNPQDSLSEETAAYLLSWLDNPEDDSDARRGCYHASVEIRRILDISRARRG